MTATATPPTTFSTRCVVLLLLLAVAPACSRVSPAQAPRAAGAESGDAREVKTARATLDAWERTLKVTGELRAFEEATLSTRVSGRLESLAVDLGSRVRRGDEIARIERRDFELRVAQADAAIAAARARLGMLGGAGDGALDPEKVAIVRMAHAEYEDARREHDRLVELADKGIASQSELDAANARLLTAESKRQDALEEVATRRAVVQQRLAELDLARQNLTDAAVAAPFDGAIAARLADRGEYLAVGDPIVRLVRFDPVRVRLQVPESGAPAARIGQTVRVQLSGRTQPVLGTLARLGPDLDRTSRTLLVEADLTNPDGALRPGAFAWAEIVLDAEARALMVPLDALVRFAGVDRVITVVDGRSVERRVTVGRVDELRAEIQDGLAEGEEVVVAPGSLRGGERVVGAR